MIARCTFQREWSGESICREKKREKAFKVMDRDGWQQTINSPKEEPEEENHAAQISWDFLDKVTVTSLLSCLFFQRDEGGVSGHVVRITLPSLLHHRQQMLYFQPHIPVWTLSKKSQKKKSWVVPSLSILLSHVVDECYQVALSFSKVWHELGHVNHYLPLICNSGNHNSADMLFGGQKMLTCCSVWGTHWSFSDDYAELP